MRSCWFVEDQYLPCAFGERGAAHGGHLGHASRCVDRDTTDPDLIPHLIFTAAAPVSPVEATQVIPWATACCATLRYQRQSLSRLDLTNAETKAENRRHILLNGVLQRLDPHRKHRHRRLWRQAPLRPRTAHRARPPLKRH